MAEIRMRIGGQPFLRYTPEAAASMVGSVQPILAPNGREVCRSEVLAAEVVDDGRSVVLTLQVPTKVARRMGYDAAASYSLRPHAVER